MKKKFIDANNAIFGRLCSYAAKSALEGHEIVIVNSEKSIISGSKGDILKKYKGKWNLGGHSLKGPKFKRSPHQIIKRGIRGMLPDHTRGIGKEALSKIKCHNGIPKEFESEKFEKIEDRIPEKYLTVGEISKLV